MAGCVGNTHLHTHMHAHTHTYIYIYAITRCICNYRMYIHKYYISRWYLSLDVYIYIYTYTHTYILKLCVCKYIYMHINTINWDIYIISISGFVFTDYSTIYNVYSNKHVILIYMTCYRICTINISSWVSYFYGCREFSLFWFAVESHFFPPFFASSRFNVIDLICQVSVIDLWPGLRQQRHSKWDGLYLYTHRYMDMFAYWMKHICTYWHFGISKYSSPWNCRASWTYTWKRYIFMYTWMQVHRHAYANFFFWILNLPCPLDRGAGWGGSGSWHAIRGCWF